MVAKLRSGGAGCTAANRLYVHRVVAGEFRAELARRLASVRIGRGTDPETTLGPLINETEHGRIGAWGEEAAGAGAEVWAEGPAAPAGGHFMSPTVLANVPEDAPVACEKVFGPVIGVRTFDEEDAVVRLANATHHGLLVGYAYPRDVHRSMRLCEQLEFGMVGLNRGIVSNAAAPFGGIKQSGLGREGSHEGLREYQEFVYAAFNA